MNFWFKKKKIVLDCFTDDLYAYNHCKIDYAVNFIPEWWKKLPTEDITHQDPQYDAAGNIEKRATMKFCRGFTRYYKRGIIIPSWAEIKIDMFNGAGKWVVSTHTTTFSHHPEEQYTGFVNVTEYQHLKLSSCWQFKTDKFMEFAFTDPVWNRQELASYTVLPGVMDFKYQHNTNINLMLPHAHGDKIKTVIINVMDPLVCLHPLTEDHIDLRHHHVSSEELESLSPATRVSSFARNGKKYFQGKKLIDRIDSNEKKCPFGFGKK
jgi:hypothetical protein